MTYRAGIRLREHDFNDIQHSAYMAGYNDGFYDEGRGNKKNALASFPLEYSHGYYDGTLDSDNIGDEERVKRQTIEMYRRRHPEATRGSTDDDIVMAIGDSIPFAMTRLGVTMKNKGDALRQKRRKRRRL